MLILTPFQDWEDSHGEVLKKVLQQVLLPHEIVGNFADIGESYRMIGHTVPCQKICAVQPLPYNFLWLFFFCHLPKKKILLQGPEQFLGNGACNKVVPRASYPFRNMAEYIFSLGEEFLLHSCLRSWSHHAWLKKPTKDPRTKLSNCIPMRLYGDGAEAQRNSEKYMWGVISRTFKFQTYVLYIHYSCWFFQRWGKQKFEILTVQFPASASSATLQNRILCHCGM